MTFVFEELDYQKTPLGDISLRRRTEPKANGVVVYEVKLGDEFLMSSLFTDSEVQLARIGLDALINTGFEKDLDIVIGGLGLGFTAHATLQEPAVRSLTVIEVMAPVIGWHRLGWVPLGSELMSDPRCTIVHADFFALVQSGLGFDLANPGSRAHGILLDIDHSPSHWLHPGNSAFYMPPGLRTLAATLHPGGVFGLWSNDPPDDDFTRLLASVFAAAESYIVNFPNPYSGGEAAATVYLAHKGR